MILINPMPAPADPCLIERLKQVDTATIGHFIMQGAMEPSLRPVNPNLKLAGRAVTLFLPDLDSALLHHATGLLRPGDVLVIDRGEDHRHACIGGGVGLAIEQSAGNGAVVDGPCTDLNEVLALELPLWCRGVSPITTRNLGTQGQMNVPITCGGVCVRPGDLILADDSGVLCLDPLEAEELIERAEVKESRSERLQAALKSGQKMGDYTGASQKILQTLQAQRDAGAAE
ncbi:MAG: RraA family protein [Cohaesibacter sp.]|nr:RraA family protein [Cohaesibacter sp.]